MLNRYTILRHSFIFILTHITCFAFAQNQDANWFFGDTCGADFSVSPPQFNPNGKMIAEEACASVSDEAGNLLFYTDGTAVRDRNHTIMPNGNGLLGDPGTTQTIIVKQPGNDNIYYIFTLAASASPAGLRFSEVDMNLNGGLGDITSYKNTPLHTPSTEKICQIRHSNGSDIWVLTHDWNSDQFRAFFIDCNGIDTFNLTFSTDGLVHKAPISNTNGYMKASPDRSKIAVAIQEEGRVQLFSFDANNGDVSLFTDLSNLDTLYGVEFSPDNSKLYVSARNNDYFIYQYDLSSGNSSIIPTTKTIIANTNTLNYKSAFGALQRAIDGKIYIARLDGDYLSAIDTPNAPGVACTFVDSSINLQGRFSNWGLPPLQPERAISDFSYTITCPGDTTYFTNLSNFQFTSLQWNFGDPGSGALNTSTAFQNVKHYYQNPGTYPIELWVQRGCVTDTVRDTITIFPAASLIPPTVSFCLDATAIAMQITPSGGTLSGPGISGSTFTPSVAGVGTHEVIYTYTDGNACTTADTQLLQVHPLPTPAFSGLNLEYCFIDTLINLTGIPTGGSFSGPGITGNSFNPIQAGIGQHQIVYSYTDGNSCTARDTQLTLVNTPPTATFTGLDTSYCINEGGSTLTGIPSGGIFSGNGISGNQFIPSNAARGVHTITYVYTDSNSCRDTARQTTTVYLLPDVSFESLDTNYCVNSAPLPLTTTPPNSVFSGVGVTNSPPTFSPGIAGPGTYILYASYTDQNGCMNSDSDRVTVSPEIILNLASDTSFCLGDTISLDPHPGILYSNTQYLWSNGLTRQVITIDSAGNYTVLASNICGTATASIEAQTRPNIDINLGADTSLCGESGITLIPTVLNPGPNGQYLWSTGATTPTLEIITTGIYTLTATGECGQSQDTIEVNIRKDSLMIPNVFSPNNDGVNDYFRVDAENETSFQLNIYNRWGTLLYSSTSPQEKWDGTYQGKEVPEGIYFYKITYLDCSDKMRQKSGDLSLLR